MLWIKFYKAKIKGNTIQWHGGMTPELEYRVAHEIIVIVPPPKVITDEWEEANKRPFKLI